MTVFFGVRSKNCNIPNQANRLEEDFACKIRSFVLTAKRRPWIQKYNL